MIRRLALTSVALLLAVSVAISPSNAFFHHTTAPLSDTYTVGSVRIEMTDPGVGEGSDKPLAPGLELSRRPVVHSTGSSPCFVRVQILLDEAGEALYNDGVLTFESWGEGWSSMPGQIEAGAPAAVYYHHPEGGWLPAGEQTAPLFEKVRLSDDFVPTDEIESFELILIAEAVQTHYAGESAQSAEEAFRAFEGL